jgi:hypothetical protein
MSRFEFKPDKKKSGRNQYIGSWVESACKEIDLPFTKESMVTVLTWGMNQEDSEYSHQEIAHWCDRFHLASEENDNELDPKIIDIAADVDAQWDIFLANTYSFEQLQELKYSEVQLPVEWFKEWHSEANT